MSVGFVVDIVLDCFEMSKPANCWVTDLIDVDAIMRVSTKRRGMHWRERKGEPLSRWKEARVVHFST